MKLFQMKVYVFKLQSTLKFIFDHLNSRSNNEQITLFRTFIEKEKLFNIYLEFMKTRLEIRAKYFY